MEVETKKEQGERILDSRSFGGTKNPHEPSRYSVTDGCEIHYFGSFPLSCSQDDRIKVSSRQSILVSRIVESEKLA